MSTLIQGRGPTTVLQRVSGTNLPAGTGLIDITGATDIIIRDLTLDGSISTPTGVNYSTFSGDPLYSALTLNSLVWIHAGCKRIRFENVIFTHTGGYAAIVDATSGDVEDVEFINCKFLNNRPHLFGTSSGDLNYGSWTGGILYVNDGRSSVNSFKLRGLTVSGCKFRRNTGNQIWGHALGFDVLNENINVQGNRFADIGLDCIQMANVIGGSVDGNHGHRIGYTTVDDTAASVPKFLSNLSASFLDTSGDVRGMTYSNNAATSINGEGCDLDGFSSGTISNNTFVVPVSGDLLYSADSIASYGPSGSPGNYTKGIQTGNTYNPPGAAAVESLAKTYVSPSLPGITSSTQLWLSVSSRPSFYSTREAILITKLGAIRLQGTISRIQAQERFARSN